MTKPRLMSGMRPTGKLHIGHLLGALENWKKLQESYDCFYMVADLHALTTGYRKSHEIPENIQEMVLDWLACGITPEKSTLYIQSHVPEISELHLLLSMVVPVSWLERVPTYKQQLEELLKERIDGEDLFEHQHSEAAVKVHHSQNPNNEIERALIDRQGRVKAAKSTELDYLATYGFLGYPLLQTADILTMKGNAVPVGQDQLPHLELAREIVRRFHFIYGKEIFPEPEALLSEAPFVPGIDGRKMSKSYNNSILISDSPEEIEEKVRQTITDPQKIHKGDPGRPEICNIFFYHRFFSPQAVVQEVDRTCRTGELGCVADKKHLASILIEKLAPIRERRLEFSKKKNHVNEILHEGAKKARAEAQKTLDEMKALIHLK